MPSIFFLLNHMKRPLAFLFLVVTIFSLLYIYQNPQPKVNQFLFENSTVTFSGIVYQITPTSNSNAVYIKDVLIKKIEDTVVSYPCQNILVYTKDIDGICVQDQLQISGSLQFFTKGTNPGQFNEYVYYRSISVSYKVIADKIDILRKNTNMYVDALQNFKAYCHNNFSAFLDEQDAGVMQAMLLGEKNELNTDIKEIYQKNGIAHILAISALHLSFVGMSLFKILKRVYIPNEIAIPLCMVILLCYGYLTNFSISTNRAIIMLIVSLFSLLVGKSYDFISAIYFSGIIILLQNPFRILNCGFLLSFGAVFAIAYVYPLFQGLFRTEQKEEAKLEEKRTYQLVSIFGIEKNFAQAMEASILGNMVLHVLDGLLLSGSINLVTFPILCYFYFDYPIYSIFLNIVILPFVSVLLVFGFFVAVLGSKFFLFSCLAAKNIHGILWFYYKVCEITLSLPNGIWTMKRPSILQIIIYYSILITAVIICNITSKKTVFCILFLLFVPFLVSSSPQLQITLLDVGQGDGILIESPSGKNYLIDGGSLSVKQLEQYRLTPCLKSKGITTIDCAFITHMDQDHISGIQELMQKTASPGAIQIKNLAVPDIGQKDETYQSLVELAKKQRINVFYIKKGDKLIDGNLTMTCCHPYKGFSSEDRNASSTVLHLKYKEFCILFTGDVQEEGEQCLIEEPLEECQVYKLAHHGSRYTNSEELLDKLQPKYAIVSAGKGNDYGHPHEEVLQRLKERNCETFCTIEQGAIILKSNGHHTYIYGYHGEEKELFPSEKLLGKIS